MTSLCLLSDIRMIRGYDNPDATITLDAYFKVFAAATTALFEKMCRRRLWRRTDPYYEYFDGNKEKQYYLQEANRYVPIGATAPAGSLYSIDVNSPFTATLIAAVDYRIFDDGLITYQAGFSKGKRNYLCIYYPGFDNTGWDVVGINDTTVFGVPEDLRKAVAMQTCINLKKASGKLGDARLGLTGKGSIEAESFERYVTGIEDEVMTMIRQYVRVGM
jgi:hypothetical protein